MAQQPLEQFYESPDISSVETKNTYELPEMRRKGENKSQESLLSTPGLAAAPNVAMEPKQRQSSWSKPLLLITVLLCFILVLLIIILGIVVYDKYAIVEERSASTTVQSVEGMNCPSAPNVSSTTTSLPNCSIVYNEWTNRMQQEMDELKARVNTLVNASVDTAWKIDDIHNFADMQTEKCINNSIDINKILETTGNSASKLINIVNTLSNLQDISTSTAGVADDILLIAQELLVLHNDSTALPTSCKEIKERRPLSRSGYYILVDVNNATYIAYCNMGTLCGSGGGWTRLAYLDMTDATQNCPSGFRLHQSGGVRACGRPNQGAGCTSSVQFPSNGISYSQICGRVTGYQFGGPDAIHSQVTNVNSTYLDGVSITRGSSRQHVWSLMAAPWQQHNGAYSCPCSAGSMRQVSSFIGSHYFCESGNPNSNVVFALYTSDPLWDGQGCGSLESPCCNVPGIPWFHRDYGTAGVSSDYIELRVCSNEGIDDEDTPVSDIEIYVS